MSPSPPNASAEDEEQVSLAQVTADARADIESQELHHGIDNPIKHMEMVMPQSAELLVVQKGPDDSQDEHAQHSNQFEFVQDANEEGAEDDALEAVEAEPTANGDAANTEDVEQDPTGVDGVEGEGTNSMSRDQVTADTDVTPANASEANPTAEDHIVTEPAGGEQTDSDVLNAEPTVDASADHPDPMDAEDAIANPSTSADHVRSTAADDAIESMEQAPEQLAAEATGPIESDPDSPGSDKDQDAAKSDAERSTATAAALAAAAAVSSAVATSTVPTMTMPMSSMIAPPSAYQPFTTMAPNGAPLIPHSLVSMPMAGGRRAVRIAPMGVLPLPPQSSVSAALAADLNQTTAVIMAAPTVPHGDVAAVDAGLQSPAAVSVPPAVPELTKGKRRGVSGSSAATVEGLTTEERTKQKRMLRNRESAARSRDKRKTKNIQLESAIAKHKAKKELVDKTAEDLKAVVTAMQLILKKHKIALPLF